MTDQVMTFDTLVEDVKTYTDRGDQKLLDQIPRFIMLAEQRIASEVRGLGFIRFTSKSFKLHDPVLTKPKRWRQTISLQYVDASGERATLRARKLEYCRVYWPQGTAAFRPPKFYADYDFFHFFFAPTPDAAYPFELAYHERPLPLEDENQRNWTTDHAPGLLLNAVLMEAALFRKRWEEAQTFQGLYDRAAQVIAREDQIRDTDRAQEKE